MERKAIWWLPVLAVLALAIGCGNEDVNGTGGIAGDGGSGVSEGTPAAASSGAWSLKDVDLTAYAVFAEP